jgi:hypothetical protein
MVLSGQILVMRFLHSYYVFYMYKRITYHPYKHQKFKRQLFFKYLINKNTIKICIFKTK